MGRSFGKYSKYSIENPEVWALSQEKDADGDVAAFIKFFKRYRSVKTVLDVGCGVGSHMDRLEKKGYECYGVDADSAKIKYAKSHFPNLKLGVQFMQALNVRKKFDAIVCIGNIIAFNRSNEEVLKTFKNFHKHLKKGGIVIIQTSNPISFLKERNFRSGFVDTGEDRKSLGIKAVYKEDINELNQTTTSTRTFYTLKGKKKVGSFTKESRMYFPQEIKFFLNQAGLKVLDFYSGKSLSSMRKNKLDSRKMLVIAQR